MVMMGHALTGRAPFGAVYFTGIVRDEQGRKMSKSLGNSPDAVKLIEKYGADGVRAGMLFSSPAGNDLLFEESLCLQGKKFVHKVWNAWRLVQGWQGTGQGAREEERVAVRWFTARVNAVKEEVKRALQGYRISEAFVMIYKVIWDDFCAHYLEMVKPRREERGKVSQEVYEATIAFFEELMALLHPFMPFITEEVWQQLRPRGEGESVMVSRWPAVEDYEVLLLKEASLAFALGSKVEQLKKKGGYQRGGGALSLQVQGQEVPPWLRTYAPYLQKKGGLVAVVAQKVVGVGTPFVFEGLTCCLQGLMPQEDNKVVLAKELARKEVLLLALQRRLDGGHFVRRAPAEVVARERKKVVDTERRIAALRALLKG